MSTRVERAWQRVPSGAAAFLVTSPVNVRYLTGFESSNAALLVAAGRTQLFTDGRYVEAASALGGVEVERVGRDLAAELGQRLPALVQGNVAFEADDLTVSRHAALAAGGADLLPTTGLVASVRAVKEASELDRIRRAAAILTSAFERFAAGPLIGRTERELAWQLRATMHELGADDVAFDPIVASGPNAALPHHQPGDRQVRPGETLLLDAGCTVAGYRSDCTRTFATGDLPPELERAYSVCLDAQQAALEAVGPGAQGRALDAIARSAIAAAGYEVMHGLGHGVGLDIHEEPRLSETSESTLEAGNVVTVEPGVYLPGVGGVRIEDLVVVHAEGLEVLTPYPKVLQVVG